MVITSKDNDFVKHVKKLKEKKYREEYGEFITDFDVTYFVVKKNKAKLHLESAMDNVEIIEHNY